MNFHCKTVNYLQFYFSNLVSFGTTIELRRNLVDSSIINLLCCLLLLLLIILCLNLE